jgi:hypothetical protein
MELSDATEKSPVTPPGIDPGTFRPVAQCPNHYATPGHTGEYMATKMEDVVTEIGIEKFRVAVTDNVSVMVKALSIFAGRYSDIAVYTYRLKSAEDTIDTCTYIVKEINKSQIVRANFTELQEEVGQIWYLKISVPARWGSIIHCFIKLLKSKNIPERFVSNEETNLSSRLRSFVLGDDVFWIYVQKHRELIQPFVKLIFLLESEKAKVSRVLQYLSNLMTALQVLSRKPSDRKGAPSC